MYGICMKLIDRFLCMFFEDIGSFATILLIIQERFWKEIVCFSEEIVWFSEERWNQESVFFPRQCNASIESRAFKNCTFSKEIVRF